jgi:FixJ family two-component response regulator
MPEKPCVLILVDDDEAVLSAMKFAFQVDGFDILAFPDAESLLAQESFPDCGCLVLDYRLPGLDGLELLRRLRKRGVSTPAVMITTPTYRFQALAAANQVPVVEKPLIASHLIEIVRDLTADPPAAC